jgi:hypothetical protein
MAITGPASYPPTMSEFIGHWTQANGLLGASPYVLTLPTDKSTLTLAQFTTLRQSILDQQAVVQAELTAVQVIRSGITLQKAELVKWILLFNSRLDGSFQNTKYYPSRPLVPGVGDGEMVFNDALRPVLSLWKQINDDNTPPPGVVLPLVLGDGTTYGAFASAVSALQFSYNAEGQKEPYVTVARSARNLLQDRAYEAMKVYREGAADKFALHPQLLDTLPRLSPLPGHTPERVNASAIFEAPDRSKVVYDASSDPMLESYQLRGNVGDDYSDEDAVVIATNAPGAPREFVTPFGLTQPGAKVALKVFVVLTTGNESGSATMFVSRPAAVLPLAA